MLILGLPFSVSFVFIRSTKSAVFVNNVHRQQEKNKFSSVEEVWLNSTDVCEARSLVQEIRCWNNTHNPSPA